LILSIAFCANVVGDGYHEVENITIHTFDAKLDKLLATIQTEITGAEKED